METRHLTLDRGTRPPSVVVVVVPCLLFTSPLASLLSVVAVVAVVEFGKKEEEENGGGCTLLHERMDAYNLRESKLLSSSEAEQRGSPRRKKFLRAVGGWLWSLRYKCRFQPLHLTTSPHLLILPPHHPTSYSTAHSTLVPFHFPCQPFISPHLPFYHQPYHHPSHTTPPCHSTPPFISLPTPTAPQLLGRQRLGGESLEDVLERGVQWVRLVQKGFVGALGRG